MEVSGQPHCSVSILSEKEPQLSGSQNRSVRGDEDKSLLLPEIEPRPSSPQSITLLIEVSGLL
jgi:hypothetical protein